MARRKRLHPEQSRKAVSSVHFQDPNPTCPSPERNGGFRLQAVITHYEDVNFREYVKECELNTPRHVPEPNYNSEL